MNRSRFVGLLYTVLFAKIYQMSPALGYQCKDIPRAWYNILTWISLLREQPLILSLSQFWLFPTVLSYIGLSVRLDGCRFPQGVSIVKYRRCCVRTDNSLGLWFDKHTRVDIG